jgi:hypothetical protein
MIIISTLPNPSNVQHNQLILSLYGELPSSKKADLKVSLLLDQNLSDEAEEFTEIQSALNNFKLEPDDVCLNNILNYAGSFARSC